MMTRRTVINALSAIAGISVAGLGAVPSEATDMIEAPRTDVEPLPRDPEIAVREEYDLAVAAGTRQALELFIARHGDHSLAKQAEARLSSLDK
jgi:hypothetical protein